MKTSAIVLRVADFLKGYPPFCYLPEPALRELAASGRVRYSEQGEILFEAGKALDRWVYVINKGAVRLVLGSGDDQELVDKRGVGDFVGVVAVPAESHYRMTALVDENAVLYLLDADVFARVCAASPQAGRFLAVFFSTDDLAGDGIPHTAEARWWEGQLDLINLGKVTGPPDCTVQEAATAMAAADTSGFLVLANDARPAGVVTETDLRNHVATGRVPLTARVAEIMTTPVVTASPDTSPADSLLNMIRHGIRHLCVTRDGTVNSQALGLLTDRDVAMSQGNNPIALVREIRRCRSPQMLRHLGENLESLLLGILRSPEDVPWCARLAAEARRSMVRRTERWARETMGDPPCPMVLALAGSAGRGEPLTQTDFPTVVVFDGTGPVARAWMNDLIERMDDLLDGAGFQPPRFDRLGAPVARVQSVEEWSAFFADLVQNPIQSEVWRRMTFFDLAPLGSQSAPLDHVQAALRKALTGNPAFIRLLANDALQNLPPVTIFEGYAVEADGLMRETVDLKSHALAPVSDVARVLNLEGGNPATTNTLNRLTAAAARKPDHARTLMAAARAFKVAQYFRSRVGLRHGSAGAEFRPALMTRPDQVLLKNAFRAIADLMVWTAEKYGFEN